jgi:hypothetical protein
MHESVFDRKRSIRLRCNVFKIVNAIVGFYSILVIDLHSWQTWPNKNLRHYLMNASLIRNGMILASALLIWST